MDRALLSNAVVGGVVLGGLTWLALGLRWDVIPVSRACALSVRGSLARSRASSCCAAPLRRAIDDALCWSDKMATLDEPRLSESPIQPFRP